MSEALDPLLHMFHKICSYKDCRGNECSTRVAPSWIWACISPWLWTVFVKLWNSQLFTCQTLTMRLSSGFLGADDVHDLWLWLIAFRINHKHWPGIAAYLWCVEKIRQKECTMKEGNREATVVCVFVCSRELAVKFALTAALYCLCACKVCVALREWVMLCHWAIMVLRYCLTSVSSHVKLCAYSLLLSELS